MSTEAWLSAEAEIRQLRTEIERLTAEVARLSPDGYDPTEEPMRFDTAADVAAWLLGPDGGGNQ